MKVRLGCFALMRGDEKSIKDAGYDAAEFSVAQVMELYGPAFKELQKRFGDTGLDFDVFDNPIPLTERICGEEFELDTWRDYLLRASERCARLGGNKYVFGNGAARSAPVGSGAPAARDKLDRFIDMLCGVSARYGITVMIEPLSRVFSNMFNTIEDCADAIRYYGISNLTSMVDLRHIVALELPMSDIVKHKGQIAHVHIDYPYSKLPDRYYPKDTDDYGYSPFFAALEEIGYSGIISVEANKYANYAEEIKDDLTFFGKYGVTR